MTIIFWQISCCKLLFISNIIRFKKDKECSGSILICALIHTCKFCENRNIREKRTIFLCLLNSYSASLCETVVPYADPGPTQRRKNAFDVGEYGMGACTNSLRLGCDCAGTIRYLDAELCNSRGQPLRIPNAICVHEEDHGILWKHVDRRMPERGEVRRSRRLVVSCISTVENYEYAFYW
jgi:Cu2+-containing amine oxidase